MRLFELLNFQHVIVYLIPGILFVLLFGIALSFSHFHTEQSEGRKTKIVMNYPDGIEEREAPFPLALIIIFVGAVLWAVFYTLGIGLTGVKI